jgi:Flp pilus assembly protein protease CpaA
MPELTPMLVVYGVGLCTGAVIDLRSGRLPNWLTFSMMALGVAIWATLGDPLFAIKGIGMALLIHFPLFALNVVRAGDAKLMMGAGALAGGIEVLDITAWYAIIYIPVGIAHLIAKGRLGNVTKLARDIASGAPAPKPLTQAELDEMDDDDPEKPTLTMLRTGPIIAVAGIVAALSDIFV